jgi:hydrogenase small subunit
MKITRRDFLKASAAITGALTLKASGLMQLQEAIAGGEGAPPVIWLQGQGCTGCSVSLLNSTYYMTIDQLLIDTLDVKYHPTVMAAAGEMAVEAAEDAREAGGYVLVIEGAIPVGEDGHYCHVWEDADGNPVTMQQAVESFASNENVIAILAIGTCACYGGMSAGVPNPTDAMGVDDALAHMELEVEAPVINIPGCPAHPDWIVGTVAALLAVLAGEGEMPELDEYGRPKAFYGSCVHEQCPNRALDRTARTLGEAGCLAGLGCRGQQTHADCPIRKWNAGWAGNPNAEPPVPPEPLKDVKNWCVGSRNPCQGCTEPDFPDGMSPFYNLKGRTGDKPE